MTRSFNALEEIRRHGEEKFYVNLFQFLLLFFFITLKNFFSLRAACRWETQQIADPSSSCEKKKKDFFYSVAVADTIDVFWRAKQVFLMSGRCSGWVRRSYAWKVWRELELSNVWHLRVWQLQCGSQSLSLLLECSLPKMIKS